MAPEAAQGRQAHGQSRPVAADRGGVPVTALHLLTEGTRTPGDPDDTWRYECVCGAWFASTDRDEALGAFRDHRLEPALGEQQ